MTSPNRIIAQSGRPAVASAQPLSQDSPAIREDSRPEAQGPVGADAARDVVSDAAPDALPQSTGRARYDYLLVVGPGRSGSDLLYENLKKHPMFSSPEIKEGYYYRSLSRYRKARALAPDIILADVSNRAWCDPRLNEGVESIAREGDRILQVMLLRRHRDRAVSIARFRRSRGSLSALGSVRHLKKSVMRDVLTMHELSIAFNTEADLMVIDFEALTADPRTVLDEISRACGVQMPDEVIDAKLNQSMKARFIPLSVFGTSIARLMRRAGFLKLLQRFKNSALIHKAFWLPSDEHDKRIEFSSTDLKTLDNHWSECSAYVEEHTFNVADGVRFRNRQA